MLARIQVNTDAPACQTGASSAVRQAYLRRQVLTSILASCSWQGSGEIRPKARFVRQSRGDGWILKAGIFVDLVGLRLRLNLHRVAAGVHTPVATTMPAYQPHQTRMSRTYFRPRKSRNVVSVQQGKLDITIRTLRSS